MKKYYRDKIVVWYLLTIESRNFFVLRIVSISEDHFLSKIFYFYLHCPIICPTTVPQCKNGKNHRERARYTISTYPWPTLEKAPLSVSVYSYRNRNCQPRNTLDHTASRRRTEHMCLVKIAPRFSSFPRFSTTIPQKCYLNSVQFFCYWRYPVPKKKVTSGVSGNFWT